MTPKMENQVEKTCTMKRKLLAQEDIQGLGVELYLLAPNGHAGMKKKMEAAI